MIPTKRLYTLALAVSLLPLCATAQEASKHQQAAPAADAADAPAGEEALNAAPAVSKEQEKMLDKGARNALKRCQGDAANKHHGDVAQGCVDLANALRSEAHWPEGARQALQRSCSLGSQAGCNELGKDMAAGGDVATARIVWGAGACADAGMCKTSLFDSYADQQPPDVASAEKVGLPLCDQGHDDRVCQRLQQIGSQADFAAIAEHHRQDQIADLNRRINLNIIAIPLLQAAVSLAENSVNSATTTFGMIAAKANLMMAQHNLESAQKNGAEMQAQLAQLMGSGQQ
jgi:hypothetical protein